MSKARNIDFLGYSKLFGMISGVLVITSWALIFNGNLKFGIDFAGGTEALVSFPLEIKVSESEIKSVAQSIGLEEPEIVQYFSQGDDKNRGYFIRSVTQNIKGNHGPSGFIADKGEALKNAISAEAALALISWDKEEGRFTLKTDLQKKYISALSGKSKATSVESQQISAAVTALKPFGLAWDAERATLTYTGGEPAKEKIATAIGGALIKLWDTADESGERIRVQFFSRPERSMLDKALVRAQITGGAVSAESETRSPVFAISSDDSVRLKTALAAQFIKNGNDAALNKEVKVLRFEKVGATAGEQLRNQGILAVLYALIFILLYIAIRFDPRYSPGAILALFHDVSLTLGIFCILGREFNLPIIAALLAIVGYSLNDTIVVYDRIRENILESKVGQKLSGIINLSVNDCLSRTILTSVTTFLAVLSIKLFGGGIIENFAFAMLVGVIVGTYSSIYIASPIVLMMDNWLTKREALKAEINKALS